MKFREREGGIWRKPDYSEKKLVFRKTLVKDKQMDKGRSKSSRVRKNAQHRGSWVLFLTHTLASRLRWKPWPLRSSVGWMEGGMASFAWRRLKLNQELHPSNLKASYTTWKAKWSNSRLAYILLLMESHSVDSRHCEHVRRENEGYLVRSKATNAAFQLCGRIQDQKKTRARKRSHASTRNTSHGIKSRSWAKVTQS